eukprot:7065208-Prymnesium_polylepis.1
MKLRRIETTVKWQMMKLNRRQRISTFELDESRLRCMRLAQTQARLARGRTSWRVAVRAETRVAALCGYQTTRRRRPASHRLSTRQRRPVRGLRDAGRE